MLKIISIAFCSCQGSLIFCYFLLFFLSYYVILNFLNVILIIKLLNLTYIKLLGIFFCLWHRNVEWSNKNIRLLFKFVCIFVFYFSDFSISAYAWLCYIAQGSWTNCRNTTETATSATYLHKVSVSKYFILSKSFWTMLLLNSFLRNCFSCV